MPDQELVLCVDQETFTIRYQSQRDGTFRFSDGTRAKIYDWAPDGLDAEVGGRRCRVKITRDEDVLYLRGPQGDLVFRIEPRFVLPGTEQTEGGFVASMPGKIVELRVQPGDRVAQGDTVLILEAMKMEHPMRATEDGVVAQVLVSAGEQVESGTLLLVVEELED